MKPTLFFKPLYCRGTARVLILALALAGCAPLPPHPPAQAVTAPQLGNGQPHQARQPGANPASASAQETDTPLELRFSVRGNDLLPGQDQRIHEVALRLTQNPKLRVTLIGSTEPLGSRGYSVAIASERVQKISSMLRKKGVRQRQIIAYPMGYSSRMACTGKHCQPGSNARVLVVFSED